MSHLSCWDDSDTPDQISPVRHVPPHLVYVPSYQLDGSFSTNMNSNQTFHNPYISKARKRSLNVSNTSSIGSNFSFYTPFTKRLRHDASICSDKCSLNASNANNSALSVSVGPFSNSIMVCDESFSEYHGTGVNNNDVLCMNCPDLSPVVATCLTCTETPGLCKLCLDAHKRVKLTKDHDVEITDKAAVDGCSDCNLTLEAVMFSAVELLTIKSKMECVDVDAAFNSALKQIKEFGSGFNKISNDEERCLLKMIQLQLLPLLSSRVKEQAIVLFQTFLDLNLDIKYSNIAIHIKDNIDKFQDFLQDPSLHSDILAIVLECLLIVTNNTKSSDFIRPTFVEIRDKLSDVLKNIKSSGVIHSNKVLYKAGRIQRELEKKCCV